MYHLQPRTQPQNAAEAGNQAGIRTELDRKDEKVGYKIRQAQLEKVPFMLVLGEKEAAEGKITVRSRDKGDLGVADLSTFIADVKKMTETREK